MRITRSLVIVSIVIVAAAIWWLRRAPAPESDVRSEARPLQVLVPAADAALPREPGEPTPASDAGVSAAARAIASGTVVDAQRRPIANAQVTSIAECRDSVILTVRSRGATPRTFATRTDARGRFTIDLDAKAPSHELRVEARGFSPRAIGGIRAGDDRVVRLERGYSLVGHVMDVDGAPIPRASVQWVGLVGENALRRVATSSPDGAFRLDDLPATQPYSMDFDSGGSYVDVRADGFAPLVVVASRWLEPPVPAGDVTTDLVLVRGATLRGRVVDGETERPVPGARVVARVRGEALWRHRAGRYVEDPEAPHPFAETVSAENGAFTFEHVPAKSFHDEWSFETGWGGSIVGDVEASATGYVPGTEDFRRGADESTIEMTLRVWPGASIRGRVVDENGQVVSSAVVTVDSELGWNGNGVLLGFEANYPREVVRTDAAGRYVIEGIRARRRGGVVVDLQARARPDETIHHEKSPSVRVVVSAGEVVEAPDLRVRGAERSALVRVRDEAGSPVCGARVSLEIDSSHWDGRTDESGQLRFRFANWPAFAGRLRLVVRAVGHASKLTPEFVASVEEPPEIEVVLAKAHRLDGRVVFSDGAPARDAIVRVGNGEIPFENVIPVKGIPRLGAPAAVLATYAEVRTAEDGSFEFLDLPAGPYHVAARVDQVWTYGSIAAQSDVESDATGLLLTLGQPSPEPRVNVTGSVTDAKTDLPVLRFNVSVQGGPGGVVYGRRVSPGKFRIDEVAPGTWSLHVYADGYPEFAREQVEIDRSGPKLPLDVTLDSAARVRGVVKAPPGVDLGDSTIVFQRGESGSFRPSERKDAGARIAPDGSFEVSGLAPGIYEPVVIVHPASRTPSYLAPAPPAALVVPPEGGELRLDLRVAPAFMLRLSVVSRRFPQQREMGTDEQRRAVADSTVEIADVDGRVAWFSNGVHWGSANVYLAAGEYVVTVRVPGADPQQRRVHLEEAEARLTIAVD